MILAQYTIRSKQAYIFRTNRLLEIVGASEIIRDTFTELAECAAGAGLKLERDDGSSFSLAGAMSRFETGELDAAELFAGGGNDTWLFRDREAFRKANAAYTRYVLERYPGLLPMCVGVEASGEDYLHDYNGLLMPEANRVKSTMQLGRIESTQPFARIDPNTLQAIAFADLSGKAPEYRTAEAEAKQRKGKDSAKTEEETRFLDRLARDGERSLLAVVHADGNNMGVKIQKRLDKRDYDSCVSTMRGFTREIDRVFREGRSAVEARLQQLREDFPDDPRENLYVRWVVTDGDDVTFICNAKYAIALTRAYLEGVHSADRSYSSCAGICVFHGHYPFARAYDLAEQACDNAKERVHETLKEQAWIDFHYLRSGVGGDLDELRTLQGTADRIGRPWYVCGDALEEKEKEKALDKLLELTGVLKGLNVGRTQIKTFGSQFEISSEAAELVWKRLCANTAGLGPKAQAVFQDRTARDRALYDISDFYDLWFSGGRG